MSPTLTERQAQRVAENLELVSWCVTRAGVPDFDVDDATQDGVFGLARAARNFDESRGTTFSTFAVPHIYSTMSRGLGTRKGSGYRRAARYGNVDDFEPPLSMDHPSWETDLPGSAATEHDAVVRAALAEATAKMLKACTDELDLIVFAEIMALHDTRGVETALERRGYGSCKAIRRRVQRLVQAARG